jgi:hypothetical protein
MINLLSRIAACWGATSPEYVAAAELIRAASEVANEHMGVVAAINYHHDEDEVGSRVCCGVVSYAEHETDCPAVRLRAAIINVTGAA